MSKQRELFTKVKDEIVCVLGVSSKPIASRTLDQEYQNTVGSSIPYARLGCTDLEEFLCYDLSDVVEVVHTKYGRHFKLKPPPEVSHVVGLMRDQKPAKHAPTRTSQSNYRYSGYSSFVPPRMKAQQSQYRSDGRPNHKCESNDPDKIPAFVQSHIVDLLRKYTDGVPFLKFGEFYEKENRYHIGPSSYGFVNWSEMLGSLSHMVKIKNTGGKAIVCLQDHLLLDTKKKCERPEASSQMKNNNADYLSSKSSQMTSQSPECTNSPTSMRDEFSSHVSDKMKGNFREILSRHTEGIWCSDLPDAYEEFTRLSLNMKDLGFYSVIEMATALSDVFTLQKSLNTSDWLLFDARVVKPESKDVAASNGPKFINDSDLHPVPLIIQRRILQVISCYEKGMFTTDFDATYKKFFGEALKPEQYGFYSIELLLKSLTHSLEMTHLDNDRVIVRVIPSVKARCDITSLKNLEDLKHREIPKDAIQDLREIPRQEIDKNVPLDNYHSIYVTSVTNPGDFWVQLRGKTTSTALDTLMDQLEGFYYGILGEYYYIHFNNIFVNLLCVATYPEDNNWHRCTVHKIISEKEVELFYLDYGSYAVVNPHCMRYMMKDFAKLPAQGIPAYLAKILPANEHVWSIACKLKFTSLVTDKPLMALIATPEVMYPLGLCLCDTTGLVDVHINDTLVSEGLAIQCDIPDQEETTELVPEKESKSQAPLLKYSNVLQEYCNQMMQTNCTQTCNSKRNLWMKVAKINWKNLNVLHTKDKRAAIPENGSIYIRSVDVSDRNTVHIINVNGKLYLTTGDVSSILWPKYGMDVLNNMLSECQLHVPMLTIDENCHGRLLMQLNKLKMLDKRFCCGDQANLCPIESLFEMMNAFSGIDVAGPLFVLNFVKANPNENWLKI